MVHLVSNLEPNTEEVRGTMRNSSRKRGLRLWPLWPLNLTDAAMDDIDLQYRKSHFVTSEVADGGFNNRLQATEIALLFGVLLNRTLLMRQFQRGHTGGKKEPYTTYLNIVGWPAFANNTKRRDALKLPVEQDRNCSVDMAKLLPRLSANPKLHDAKIAIFTNNWGFWQILFRREHHRDIAAFLSRHVQYKQNCVSQVTSLLPKPFAAVHARFGDRRGFPLFNCSLLGYNFGNGTKKYHSREAFACSRPRRPDPDKARNLTDAFDFLTLPDALAAWNLPPEVNLVYFATNRPKDPTVKQAKDVLEGRNLSVRFWEDLKPHDSKDFQGVRDGSWISIAEQCIAMEAERFMPSWPSSWDSVVITRRLAAGKPDAEEHHNLMTYHLERHARYTKCNFETTWS